MKNINYENCVDIVKNINNKIVAIIIISKDCTSCSNYINNSLKHIVEKYSDIFEVYLIENKDIPTSKIFPSVYTPISYFFIKNCDVFPIIRPGVANLNQLENELLKFKLILKGDKFEQVFSV